MVVGARKAVVGARKAVVLGARNIRKDTRMQYPAL
jgi:hypothetical protein